MKRKIQKAFEHQTPNVLHSVLSACENEKGEIVVKKENWQSVTPRKPKRFSWTAVAGIAAMIAVIVGIGFAVMKGASKPAPESQMPYAEGDQTESTEDSTEPTESTELVTKETEIVEPTEPEIEWDIPSLVAQYNIAPAKAEMVLRALEYHPEYTIEELLEVDRETLFWNSMNFSAEEYPIGVYEATKLAVEHVGASDAWNSTCKTSDRVHEISFNHENFTYTCYVNADTGEVQRTNRTENPDAADEQAAMQATLAFMEDFTPITFLGEDRDLTQHLADQDAEIWANAIHFLPMATARCYDDEFWLTNQYDYILEYAEYWKEVRNDIVHENVQIRYSVEKVHVFGDFAQVYLYENKSFRYEGQSMDSFMEDDYEIMLINDDGTWKVFDLTSSDGGEPLKYPNGLPEPPLVTEAYSGSYAYGDAVWQQHLPQVMINSEYAQQINDRIYAWAEDLRQMIPYSGISYEYDWYSHGDLLTIAIHKINTNFDEQYYNTVYTLRLSDGGKATREEILAAADVDEEELIERAYPLIAHTFGTSFGGESMQEMAEYLPSNIENSGYTFLQYTFGRSVSRENIQESTLYLDKDGTLCFQAKIYQIAGADYHEREYRIDDVPEKSPIYETMMTYGIGWEIPIDNGYPFEEVFLKAFETAGVSESEVADLQGFVTYYVTRDSYYRITFSVQGEPHTYYISVGTLEILDEMGG